MPEPSPPRSRALRTFGPVSTRTTAGPDAFGHADHGVGIGVEQGLVVDWGVFGSLAMTGRHRRYLR